MCEPTPYLTRATGFLMRFWNTRRQTASPLPDKEASSWWRARCSKSAPWARNCIVFLSVRKCVASPECLLLKNLCLEMITFFGWFCFKGFSASCEDCLLQIVFLWKFWVLVAEPLNCWLMIGLQERFLKVINPDARFLSGINNLAKFNVLKWEGGYKNSYKISKSLYIYIYW